MQRMILSVSRRTDIPAFYLDSFLRDLHKGFFTVRNPVSGKPSIVPATKDKVAGFVFWSKDYTLFLKRNVGEEILEAGMGIYFQFTVNSPDTVLEAGVPSLAARLEQLAELADRFGGKNIAWRFDPICHWKDFWGGSHHNLEAFPCIAEASARAGIPSCTTSFLDLYPKVLRRAAKEKIFFYDPAERHKKEILLRMAKKLGDLGMELRLCCEETLLSGDGVSFLHPASCVSGNFLEQGFGSVSKRKDPGQRKECHCTLSRDIGSYTDQKCRHHCLYCYAG